MADKITVTSKNSYGSRIKNSFGKIWLWFILVIASIFFIFKNEQNFLQTKVALNEWAEIVKETTSTEINPELDQAEVHLHWETNSPTEVLKDPIFGVAVNDLKLARNVQMYQWSEESSEECTDNIWWSETCETTYSYSKTWEDTPIDSNSFYESAWHENPITWKYESQEREKHPILVWKYTLDDIFVWKLLDFRTVDLSTQEVMIPEEYKSENNQISQSENTVENAVETNTENIENNIEANNNSYLYWEQETWNTTEEASDEEMSDWKLFHINNGYIYIWKNESNPEIWDLKITFSSVKTWIISIVGQQDWESLRGYIASNGKTIALLSQWNVSADQMFASAQKANKNLTWLFRCLLLLAMFIWFSMMFEFLVTLAKFLPFLSNIIGAGTSLISLALTLVFGFLSIGISRLAVRPVVWISCFVMVLIWIIMLVRTRKNKKVNVDWQDKWNDKNIEIIEA